MDVSIFVDVLLDHAKELTWLSVAAELGCSGEEARRILNQTVVAALERLPPELSLQCVLVGPASAEEPLGLQCVQTEASGAAPWPPKDFLSALFGGDRLHLVELQSVWTCPKGMERQKNLVATDDLFHDLYAKAHRALQQDTLYIPPFAEHILSKLERRKPAAPSASPLPATDTKSVTPSPALVSSAALLTPAPAPAQPKSAQPVQSSPPQPPPAKRRKNMPKKRADRVTGSSPIVAISAPPPPPPCTAELESSAIIDSACAPASPTMEEPASEAPPPRGVDQENLLFPEQEDEADRVEEAPAPPAPKSLFVQQSGPLKEKAVETMANAKGGLGFSVAATETAVRAPSQPAKSVGGTLDSFFKRG